ncbi:MAG: PSD1 and planctomycete cytochrome C domain-containing protein [Verrucomicrobiota bacterium]
MSWHNGLTPFGAVLISLAGLLHAALWSYPTNAATDPNERDFFENKIRPILAGHCYECHSPARGKIKGGLELDWKGGWTKGGSSGPAVVPGDPEQSLLIKAVRYADPDLQMPPKGKQLSPGQVADLVAWVKMGAPDPRETRPGGVVLGRTSGSEHWAFKPVLAPVPPPVRPQDQVKNDIDRFVLARLETDGLEPAAAADKRTLLRRVYYDLVGLPPTPEQINAFLADDSSQAFERVVDELLASPHYGERWARHWLDLARYSDSKGQVNRRREGTIYAYAWVYRDYVINALNQDKPYDRFVLEQLAADRLNLGTNQMALAALGFLTLGERFNGNTNEIINDRIDVTCKAFLGLTVSCARCHDHKFDPLPQADYYALHGIFASSTEPALKPEILHAEASADRDDYLAKRKELDGRLYNVRTQNLAKVYGDYRRLAGVYLYATRLPEPERIAYLTKMGGDTNLWKNWQETARIGGRQASAIFGLWNAFARIPEVKFGQQGPRLFSNLDRFRKLDGLSPYVREAFRGTSPKTLGEVAAVYGKLFASNDPGWQTTLSALLGDAALRFLPNRERGQIFALREQSDFLEMVHPGAMPRAPVLVDAPNPKDSTIFIRGEAENRGPTVPRRFLEVLSGPNRPAFKNGSGRLELAQAIASPNNPLTARVLVNRVWQHHFGEGLVRTPDDFGAQSEAPTHPELLDYLASRFMSDGWSLKKLHKLILTSATYQRSSQASAEAAAKDPGNRLLSHANVRRLEFEPLRDSILYVGGNLDLTVGGHPVDLSQGTRKTQRVGGPMQRQLRQFRLAAATRRTIYGFIDRSDPFEALNIFDVAQGSSPTGRRYESIVPQQALYLMNSALVVEQVRGVVQRDEFQAQKSPADRIRSLYEIFYQRLPTQDELRTGQEFIRGWQPRAEQDQPLTTIEAKDSTEEDRGKSRPARSEGRPGVRHRPLGPWEEYAHALLLANEASFVN